MRARMTVVCGLALAALAAGGGEAWAAAGWSSTGPLRQAAENLEAVVLDDGRVLSAGGIGMGSRRANADLFDPDTRTWTPTADLAAARDSHSVTVLADGRVLVAGGFGAGGGALSSAEIYDPATGAWTPGGSMGTARGRHIAVRLADGRVLVAGGSTQANFTNELFSAEIYDPVTNTWSPTASLAAGRDHATATRLQDGRVLVVGGLETIPPTVPQPDAEIYDPATGSWMTTPDLAVARTPAPAVTLADGRVLVAGDDAPTSAPTTSELYDPATNTWGASATGLVTAGRRLSLEQLADGSVVAIGGGPSTAFERFDPAAGTWTALAPMATPRQDHASAALDDGRLLVVGGGDGNGAGSTPIASTELWTPAGTRTASGTAFAARDIGVAGEQDVTLTAGPNAGLFVTGLTLGGANAADFVVVDDDCTDVAVAAGGTCTVRVRFTPGAAGTRTATLTLADNTSDGAVALTGTGTAPKEEEKPPPTPERPAPPAPPAAAPRQEPPTPRVCVSRRTFSLSAWLPKRTRVASGTVTLDGQRIARLTSRSRSVTVDLRGKPRGTYTVELAARTQKGNRIAITRRYRTCEKRGA